LFFIQQGYSQNNPYFISAGPARSINDFYGLNGQNTIEPNSCYADNDVRTEILKAQPSYLRYPGGEVANYWDWQEGWFYRNVEENKIYNLFSRVVEFNVDNQQVLHVYLDSLRLANENIIANDIVNENEKALNKITAAHDLKCFDNYSPSEISIVTSIAMQCPREGGASVYRAREIMLSINPNLIYNDDNQCNVLLARKANSKVNMKNDLVFVADKSNGELKFLNKSNDNLNCVLFVYDALGREILYDSINLSHGAVSIPFDNKYNGIYMVKIMSGNSRIDNFKFSW